MQCKFWQWKVWNDGKVYGKHLGASAMYWDNDGKKCRSYLVLSTSLCARVKRPAILPQYGLWETRFAQTLFWVNSWWGKRVRSYSLYTERSLLFYLCLVLFMSPKRYTVNLNYSLSIIKYICFKFWLRIKMLINYKWLIAGALPAEHFKTAENADYISVLMSMNHVV